MKREEKKTDTYENPCTHSIDIQTHNSCCRDMTLALNGKNCLNNIKVEKKEEIAQV